jgi:hypothetical protein
VLKGKLVVDAILMTSIQSILQDEHGDAVKVGSTAMQQLLITAYSHSYRSQRW